MGFSQTIFVLLLATAIVYANLGERSEAQLQEASAEAQLQEASGEGEFLKHIFCNIRYI